MNYIKHLAGFFDKVSQDSRLNPTHISLYISLFQCWNLNRFQNPISISRSEMMRVSKISANATYHKVIKQLHEYGYIVYEPSYNPFKGSMVHLVNFSALDVQQMNSNHATARTNNEQAMNGHHTKTDTGGELALVPYINNTNIPNSKQDYERSHEMSHDKIEGYKNNFSGEFHATENKKILTHENSNSDFNGTSKEEKTDHRPSENFHTGGAQSSALKEISERDLKNLQIPRSLRDVQLFFEEEKSTKHEAKKFFNHYQSNGWKVGGRSPMKDWQASARKWILKTADFASQPKPSLLHTTTVKNYAEPL